MRDSGVAALVAGHRIAARMMLVNDSADATSTLRVRVRQHATLVAHTPSGTCIHNNRRCNILPARPTFNAMSAAVMSMSCP
jgi:hypothetical protein